MSVDLSAIVITRNEEGRIAACLEACIESIRRAQRAGLVGSAEIVLCDSASTDRTVEIAQRFPATIVQLPTTFPLSAAAGRFVGLRYASSEYLLFVDGDYVLLPDWLSAAVRAMEDEPSLGAVCGLDLEELTGPSLLSAYQKRNTEAARGPPEAVPIGLYRRSALTAAGGIHPFLRGGEDRDLVHRIRNAGFGVLRQDLRMGVHRWAETGDLDFITYFHSVLAWSLGDGQLFRIRRDVATIRTDQRRRYANARHLYNYLLTLSLGIVLLANAFSIISGVVWPGAILDALALTLLTAARVRTRRSWRELIFQLHAAPYTLIRHLGFALGFLRSTPPPSRYPSGERVVKRGLPIRGPPSEG